MAVRDRGRLRVAIAARQPLPPRVRIELRAFACRGDRGLGLESESAASFPLQRAPVAQVPTPAQASPSKTTRSRPARLAA
ncbi:hypothetical protein VSS74_00060 [Conexibacter stalactiti]|uniref:Uncharacterized protein n=1 Tax=Conexibacter stalactiti TaxID=1940611 RepID=A0ABU4HHF3_9ACTN|nr:hypothetical protein [Conexibacter stalactiti]MDW5592707.1 hypothetical protein [Conexibacter stalactiti]MEC5033348.1 hypothetical protein [Conexibacter stalactiti]